MRFLGVDPGGKRVGVAISDPGETFASPLVVIHRRSFEQVVRDIAALCREEAVGGLVVGLPLNMDGSHGPMAQEAARLGEALAAATGLPVELWDERLSSENAERHLIDADMSRARRKKTIDKVAAQIILQSYLDTRRRTTQV
jgi:putative Holliday junction resolvase